MLAIVRAHRGTEVHVFGSVARGDDTSESDVDLLVTFEKVASLFDLIRMQRELEELLGRKVDVLDMDAVRHPLDGWGHHRRDRMLKDAVLL